jgi:hypothetical protein
MGSILWQESQTYNGSDWGVAAVTDYIPRFCPKSKSRAWVEICFNVASSCDNWGEDWPISCPCVITNSVVDYWRCSVEPRYPRYSNLGWSCCQRVSWNTHGCIWCSGAKNAWFDTWNWVANWITSKDLKLIGVAADKIYGFIGSCC